MPVETKTIAKNTIFLYIRMFVTMAIGLFSVRIVLHALGETDYGIFNVVGGVVTMLAFLNNSLATTTQRFLSYELSGNNKAKLQNIFSTSLTCYIILIILILVFAETIGLWFVNNKLVIPHDRMQAANYVYQFSILAFVFTVLAAPYNAALIAHEKMSIYAYVCIIEAIGKLLVVFLLINVNADKLILYGALLFLISVFVFIFYKTYCLKHYEECYYKYLFDNKLFKEIANFAGWGIWGSMSNIFKGQGINFLLNIFFGTVANASRAITYQLDSAVNTLIQNIYTAVRPEIIKSYAVHEFNAMFRLVNIATRLGFYLMLMVTPIFILETPYILDLWLKDIPEYTVSFTRLVLGGSVMFMLAQPLIIVIHATGRVALYQFISGCINILVLPVSWVMLRLGYNATAPFFIIIIAYFIYWLFTLFMCNKLVRLSIRTYTRMILKMILITPACVCLPILLHNIMEECFLRLILIMIINISVCILLVYYIDLSAQERSVLSKMIINKISHNK